ncbi:MAG: hypothetical protein ACEQSK_12515 [Sphingomonadaceae bacterium]
MTRHSHRQQRLERWSKNRSRPQQQVPPHRRCWPQTTQQARLQALKCRQNRL